MLNAHRESHNAAQPHFAALPLLILFSSAGFTMGCAGSTGGTGATSPIVPPLPPPPSVIVTIALATASLLLGNAETFTATVTGTKNTTVSWNVNGVAGGNPAIGTITAAGVYTAPVDLPLAPAVQITATSNSDPTKSANATLTITSDIAIALSPATASVILGASQPFRAAIVSNGRPDTTVRWSISGPACPSACGSLDANGNYTAPQILPTLTNVTVTAQSVADPSKQASATIAILSDVTVSLTPTAIGVELGAIQPFHAAINSSGSPNTAIRWSIAGPACPAVCGSLDASGNYTAPQTLPASATLTLTAQSVADPSKQASAAITITSNFSLQLSAPSSVASGASSIIAATLTPVPGSNPNTTLSWTLTGAGCSRTSCGVLAVATTQPLGGGATSTSATYTAPATPPTPIQSQSP